MSNSKDPTYAKWEAKNAMVMSWLLHSMQLSTSNNYSFLSTAKAIWDSVTKTSLKRGNKARMYDLH